MAFLSGLALAHMVTVALIVPPLLWFLLSRRTGLLRRGRLVLAAVGIALLPLRSYLFIYIRGAEFPQWRGAGSGPAPGPGSLDFVGTQQGRDELTWSLDPLWTDGFPSLLWRELTWIVLLGGLLGIFC